ncbi:MAG: CubicO group peptidase (beta-lactamase class C family), partial [Myxococcota bacterium]
MKMSSLLLLTLTLGCETDPEPDLISCDGDQCFSIEQFGENIADSLDPSTVGWSYVLYYEGKAEKWGGGGDWRTPADPPQILANIYDPFNMGSIGKSITAIGTIIALDESSEADLDDPVAGWFPSDWYVGPGAEG